MEEKESCGIMAIDLKSFMLPVSVWKGAWIRWMPILW